MVEDCGIFLFFFVELSDIVFLREDDLRGTRQSMEVREVRKD